ncbi:MAG: EthD family reductase [Sulfuritalea sp.]|jgi:uncharacterized protein (TIGR02118 family)|uniref:EthD family reductase n=1 Tax=Aquabacterium sp. TaxID=1872578 RepID=UPI001B63832C|nr:EthD family reductase [Aquabacterium sp.]MBK7022350.1 EthD family reductase [Sulfuritalea sp.]MBP7133280.1 EthD family reductase [Aquabacterium sp.]
MIRVTVSYPTTADASFDHGYYETKHRALVQSLMGPHGLVRVEMDRYLSDGRGQPAPVVAAAHLLFTDMASFQAAMAAVGKTVNADIRNYTSIVPSILISETVA